MALDFPSNPNLNDTYTLDQKTWVYNGYGWEISVDSTVYVPPANVTVSVFNTVANGTVDTFALGIGVDTREQLIVTIDGVLQPETTYTVNTSANTITFGTTPVIGETLRVLNLYTRANTYVIADGSVTPEKLSTSTNNYILTTATSAAEASAIALSIALG